jgi:Tol biopolymer transport system component
MIVNHAYKGSIIFIFFIYLFAFSEGDATLQSYASEKIAFQSDRDGNFEIYIMNENGSGQTRLTKNSAADLYPTWCPKSETIAFISLRDGNCEIYVINADGTSLRNLTLSSTNEHWPAWSPDGTQIAFASDQDGDWEIFVMDKDEKKRTQITHNLINESEPAWIPTGKGITYTRAQRPAKIYLTPLDGRGETILNLFQGMPPGLVPECAPHSTSPAWSSRNELAFASTPSCQLDIFITSLETQFTRQLTNNPGIDTSPAFSHDGKRLAFMSDREGNFDIFVVDTDGKNLKRLTSNEGNDGYPTWSSLH